MKIIYCNDEKLHSEVEKNMLEAINADIDNRRKDSPEKCLHNSVEIFICNRENVDNPYRHYLDGHITCNNCNKKLIIFKGDVENPYYHTQFL